MIQLKTFLAQIPRQSGGVVFWEECHKKRRDDPAFTPFSKGPALASDQIMTIELSASVIQFTHEAVMILAQEN